LAIKRLAENPQGKRRPETGAEIHTEKRSEKRRKFARAMAHSVGAHRVLLASVCWERDLPGSCAKTIQETWEQFHSRASSF